MHDLTRNPFSETHSHYPIWEMCVRRDLEAYLAADWTRCADDFKSEGFVGWDAGHNHDPLKWKVTFPSLDSYRESWLIDAQNFKKQKLPADIREQLYQLLSLVRIELKNDTGIVHKKFNGVLKINSNSEKKLAWQSIFFLKKENHRWLQAGFIGYLPLELTSKD